MRYEYLEDIEKGRFIFDDGFIWWVESFGFVGLIPFQNIVGCCQTESLEGDARTENLEAELNAVHRRELAEYCIEQWSEHAGLRLQIADQTAVDEMTPDEIIELADRQILDWFAKRSAAEIAKAVEHPVT